MRMARQFEFLDVGGGSGGSSTCTSSSNDLQAYLHRRLCQALLAKRPWRASGR